ncbi:MAG TPA: hypothetical protein VFU29_23450 [Chitinophagaceae bacterium]|nr:hypothetical protein [Chitinophagaceae bacterium]
MGTLSSTLLIIALTLVTIYSSGQENDEKILKQVLEKGLVDSEFVFGKWTEHGGTETHLKYLGHITNKKGKVFKIVTSSWIWGLSHRATSRILIFNNRDQYIGEYYVITVYDLPTKLQNGNLIFKNTDDDCDKKLFTVVSLNRGLPKKFFRKCKGKFGDVYSFYSD